MQSIGWYWKRLRVMGPAEVAHRVREGLAVQSLRLHRPSSAATVAREAAAGFEFCRSRQAQMPVLRWAALEASAQAALLAGQWPALGYPWAWRAADGAVWHEAPDTRRRWPLAFFAAVPYRAGNPYGDARVVWEPSRLQQLVALARVAREDPQVRSRAVALVESVLESWLGSNPPFRGVHYVSAMECALRVVAVCHALDLVRNFLVRGERTWALLVALVASHATLIARRLSLHSSAGNHTIAEAVGLIYAGCLFPELRGARRLLATGREVLAGEARRQVLADGGGIEQAPWYQLFIVDLMGLALALLRHRGEPVPAVVVDAVERGRAFLQCLGDAPQALPPIGDRDDGYALSPDLRISWDGTPPVEPLQTLPESGYTLVRGDRGGDWLVVLDHGPLGMPPSCGHGHADALAVLLRARGAEVLTDAGTFTYTGDPGWRRWFRGTAAHNTVTVDRSDQATQETAFQWSRPYRAELVWRELAADGTVRLLARHDGYRGRGVEHWRGLVVRADGTLVVLDRLVGPGRHRSDLHWHLGPGAREVEGGASVPAGASAVRIRVLGTAGEVVRGGQGPTRAWRSSRYGVREASLLVHSAREGLMPHEFITLAGVADPGPDAAQVSTWLAPLRSRMP